jgi:hypothetical protein
MKRSFLIRIVLSAAVGCGGTDVGETGGSVPAPASLSASTSSSDVRRICLREGIAGIGGGSIVRLVNTTGASFVIETLNGVRATIPAQANGGQATLCEVPSGPMKVCPADPTHTGAVPFIKTLSNVRGGAGAPSGTVARGTDIVLWDHVHDGAGHGKTVGFVTVNGQEGFIPPSEICFATSYPEASVATSHLQMRTTWQDASGHSRPTTAAGSTYRPRPPTTISRLVVHNTEEPFVQTMSDFTSGARGTSAHVVLDRDGTLYRVVEDQFAAYHAGGSADGMGTYNNTTLGVEVVAYDGSQFGGSPHDADFPTDAQRTSLVDLLRTWMTEYHLELGDSILRNSSSSPGYADLEYATAPLTIHRLTRVPGTDCPRLLWANSPDGDEAFFRWRQQTFGAR